LNLTGMCMYDWDSCKTTPVPPPAPSALEKQVLSHSGRGIGEGGREAEREGGRQAGRQGDVLLGARGHAETD